MVKIVQFFITFFVVPLTFQEGCLVNENPQHKKMFVNSGQRNHNRVYNQVKQGKHKHGKFTPREGSDLEEICGKENTFTERTNGGQGQEAKPNQFPWMVYHFLSGVTGYNIGFHACSSFLIAHRWLITAAHCVYRNPNYAYLMFGAHDLSDLTEPNRNRNSTYIDRGIVYYPETSLDGIIKNDIVLIKLSRPISAFNNYIRPICLLSYSEAKETFDGMKANVVGWDWLNDKDLTRTRKVHLISNILIESKKTCQDYYPNQDLMCTKRDRKNEVCRLGSGSPISIVKDGRHIVIGFAVVETNCEIRGYQRVTPELLKWINNITGVPIKD